MISPQLFLLVAFTLTLIIDFFYVRWRMKLRQQGKSITSMVRHIFQSIFLAGKSLVVKLAKIITVSTKSLVSRWLNRSWSNTEKLFGLAIVIYLMCISIGLDRFPVYFFTDEAVHANLAADFLRDGFRNYQHEFLPTYFSLGPMFSLNGVSVYLQIIPYLLFGKSVFVTRFISGIITLLGAIAVGLILRDIFMIRHYWLGILMLITTPAWFLHARTTFEYMELSAFYAGFIYCYLLYRKDRPKALYGAVIFGALAFYTHGLGQVLMGATALILFVVDLRYHFERNNRITLAGAFMLALALSLPFLRFYLAHSQAITDEIRQRGSYWTNTSLSLLEKLRDFGREYVIALNARYWYFPNGRDLIRHVMKGYGHLLWPMLPFAVLGLGKSLLSIKLPQYRTVLIALLVSPIPASLVAIGITRVLWEIIPITIITIIGLTICINWLEQHLRLKQGITGGIVFITLATFSIFMLNDALVHGPTWYNDYTLYGLQFGGKQVFLDTILPSLKQDSNVRYVVSPNWANGIEQILYFFIPNSYLERVQFGIIDGYLAKKIDFTPETLFVMIPEEYARAIDNPIFKKIQVEKIINHPDGSPGFYIAHLTYADNAAQIISAQRAVQPKFAQGEAMIDGQLASITYSRIDMGQLENMFDGNYYTLMRGAEANPFTLYIVFPNARTISGFIGDFATMDYTINVRLYPPAGNSVSYEVTKTNLTSEAHVEMQFDRGPKTVSRIVINITDLNAVDETYIHLREIRFLP